MTGWTAILLAGQRPGVDPLAAHFGESWKALVKVGGEAMLSHTTHTLLACPSIRRVLILAQDTAALTARADTAWISSEPRVTFMPSEASISQSVRGASRSSGFSWPALVTTAEPAALAAWVAPHRAGVDRARRTVDEIAASGADWSFAKLTIANSALRQAAG